MAIQTRRAISLRRPVYEQLRIKAAHEKKTMSGITEQAVLDYLNPTRASREPVVSVFPAASKLISDLKKSWGM